MNSHSYLFVGCILAGVFDKMVNYFIKRWIILWKRCFVPTKRSINTLESSKRKSQWNSYYNSPHLCFFSPTIVFVVFGHEYACWNSTDILFDGKKSFHLDPSRKMLVLHIYIGNTFVIRNFPVGHFPRWTKVVPCSASKTVRVKCHQNRS